MNNSACDFVLKQPKNRAHVVVFGLNEKTPINLRVKQSDQLKNLATQQPVKRFGSEKVRNNCSY